MSNATPPTPGMTPDGPGIDPVLDRSSKSQARIAWEQFRKHKAALIGGRSLCRRETARDKNYVVFGSALLQDERNTRTKILDCARRYDN